MVDHILDFVDEADTNNDGKIDYDEWLHMGVCSFCLSCHVFIYFTLIC